MELNRLLFRNLSGEDAYIISKKIKNIEQLTIDEINLANKDLLVHDDVKTLKNYFYDFSEKYLNTIFNRNVNINDYNLFDIRMLNKQMNIKNNELDKYIVRVKDDEVLNLSFILIKIFPITTKREIINENISFYYHKDMLIKEILLLIKEICYKKYRNNFEIAYIFKNDTKNITFDESKAEKFNLKKYENKTFMSYKIKNVDIVVLLKKYEIKKGLIGLKNIGNTCYMNSAIQILAHTPFLKEYLLDKNFENEVNLNNPLGYNGQLMKSFYEVFYNIWEKNEKFFIPKKFKSFISKCNPMFEGNEQHDSSEFLSYLIDNLHEEVNLIQKKPYTEKLESDDINIDDNKFGKDSWIVHLKRNYSFINSLFYGQYKSTIKCPECKKISITFDPFQIVYLPIPKNIKRVLKLFYYDEKDFLNKKFFKINFSGDSNVVNNYKIYDLKKKLCDKLEIDIDKYKLINNDNQEEFYEKKLSFYEINAQNIDLSLIKMDENDLKIKDDSEDNFITVQLNLERYLSFVWHFDYESTIEDLVNKIFDLFKDFFENKFNLNLDDFKEKEYWSKLDDKNKFLNFKMFLKTIDIDNKNMKIKSLLNINKEFEKRLKLLDTIHCKKYKNQIKLLVKIPLTFYKKYNINYFFKSFEKEEININLKKIENNSKIENNLVDLFKKFSYPEKLDKNNTWYCSKCKEHIQAIKILEIFKLPPILIVVMKKLKDNNTLVQNDSENSIEFPFNLNMDNYVLNKNSMGNYNINNNDITENWKENKNINDISNLEGLDYELYGVINHIGNFAFGHYYSYIKINDKWYEFNDTIVKEINKASIITKHAYVLVYKKSNL